MSATGLGLAWRLAKRELRGGLAGFRVFVVCLALGVAAIAAVGWTSSAILGGLKADAGKLLGGDFELRLIYREANDAQMRYLMDNSRAISNTIEMRAMATSTTDQKKRTLVQLKAVDGGYPLTGDIVSSADTSLDDALALKDGMPGALVDPNLLDKLGLQLGDDVKIGKTLFQVRATIVREPDRVTSMINFGPRLMIGKSALASTGLIQPGSLVQYYYRLTLDPGVDRVLWRQQLSEEFPDAGWRVRGTDEAAPGVRRFIDRLTLFMSFVGYTVLLVGGVGITRDRKSVV